MGAGAVVSRLFFIPDIHGRLDLLDALLLKLADEHDMDLLNDKIIFGGDYIDRGPDSRGVLAKVRLLTETFPKNVIALAGNHEWLAIKACAPGQRMSGSIEAYNLWQWNGGGQTLESYPNYKMPEDDIRWLASLPVKHEEPGFFFSHAPLPLEKDRKPQNQGGEFTMNELTWTYHPGEGDFARVLPDGVVGVCGHIHGLPRSKMMPRFWEHYIFADSGCGCHPQAPLVAVEVRTREVIYAHPVAAPSKLEMER